MNATYNSHAQQNLILLKNIARRGGGRGPHYDQGILSVVEQIERDGHFVPSGVRHLVDRDQATSPNRSTLTHAEMDELQDALAARGWNTEEWAEFAAGVARAEAALKAYRDPATSKSPA